MAGRVARCILCSAPSVANFRITLKPFSRCQILLVLFSLALSQCVLLSGLGTNAGGSAVPSFSRSVSQSLLVLLSLFNCKTINLLFFSLVYSFFLSPVLKITNAVIYRWVIMCFLLRISLEWYNYCTLFLSLHFFKCTRVGHILLTTLRRRIFTERNS